jgi:hypothetical protein
VNMELVLKVVKNVPTAVFWHELSRRTEFIPY